MGEGKGWRREEDEEEEGGRGGKGRAIGEGWGEGVGGIVNQLYIHYMATQLARYLSLSCSDSYYQPNEKRR